MKVRVNPLVLAAALGLLGPAALDEETPGPVGLWRREGGAPDASADQLGERIEVLAIEDRFYFDEGQGTGLADAGTWTRLADGALVQELALGSALVRREFRAEEDILAVRTLVQSDGERHELEARFTRLG